MIVATVSQILINQTLINLDDFVLELFNFVRSSNGLKTDDEIVNRY